MNSIESIKKDIDYKNLILNNFEVITTKNTKQEIENLYENIIEEVSFENSAYIETIGINIEQIEMLGTQEMINNVYTKTYNSVSKHYKAKHKCEVKYENNYEKYIMDYYISQISNIVDKPIFYLKLNRFAIENEKINLQCLFDLRDKLIERIVKVNNIFIMYWEQSELNDEDCTYIDLINLKWSHKQIIDFYKEVINQFLESLKLTNEEYNLIEEIIFSTYTKSYLIQNESITTIIDDTIKIIYSFDSIKKLYKLKCQEDYSGLLLVDILAHLYLCYNKLK